MAYSPPVERERKLLQRVVAVAALVPVGFGLAGVILGSTLSQSGSIDIATQSHYRYLSGLLLGIGLLFWSTVPSIEIRTNRFRILTLIVFVGGLSRLVGFFFAPPALQSLAGAAMELVVTPALCLWQGRVAARCAEPVSSESHTVPEILPPQSVEARENPPSVPV